ncbi:glycosyltransferase family 2 protein [Protaetiibacter mangrovi]|uniref:Glycosyltransferase family 2 protein n=1 Tax=Protaetiibacter mangrovi TaxID=2970926 RepID=A0ABT1ZFM6_9MICO|nr:glycosyltransferase family 2 protein [Protaetiibacter mangrovi]MCS0499481.1 glycosyltransferase family 2 protein [Protaetiibacter mangrovi]TPW96483.1 glycosyltransferase family 2 protein [Schumannella luteola]
MNARVAVVTVSYNSARVLPEFLASIPPAGGAEPIVIADNASPEFGDTERIAREHDARVLRLPDNRGYGGAVNAAMATLPDETEYVVIANPDVVLHAEAITRLVAVADRTPGAGAVGPQILDPDGTTYPSARRLPSLRTGVGHALFGPVWPGNPWTRSYREDRQEPVERDAGWLSGACLLVRRRAFAQIGGFDEGYFMYFEDVDLGKRLGDAGWSNRYAPDAVVTHSGAHSTSGSKGAMARAHHRSAYRYVARRYSSWYLAPVRLVLRVGIALREAITVR